MFLVSTRTAPLLLLALACGACAGLWDLSAAALHETLAIRSPFPPPCWRPQPPPRRAPLLALAVAAGVLLAHLVSPPPPERASWPAGNAG
ncbi:hypothetical protein RC1_3436 [Rhodospirillum centenum SW]|uniref:Uncharacterized protein n=1 Tax=Rhodospirillum centenum (strain ATCC 51521 / SW) TaxID=414684 RepID=B6IWX0_RHOCS|nr:hypothetical protein RC1_3436 [Rhodospirillum centenum SW]